MPKRLICTVCNHVWHADVLEQQGADRCPFCSGSLVDERLDEPRPSVVEASEERTA